MILKVKSCDNPEEWLFFGDVKEISKQIHYVITNPEESSPEKIINKMVVRADVYDLTKNDSNSNENKFLEIWLYGKTPEETKQILCFSPAYLINDEGKTIEKF